MPSLLHLESILIMQLWEDRAIFLSELHYYKKINQKTRNCRLLILAMHQWVAVLYGKELVLPQWTSIKRCGKENIKGGLPLIFNFMNNLYGMGGQTCGETMGYGILARIGAGVNPEMMHAERVDGYNPLAVIDAFKRKKKIIEEKKGPVLLDTLTYRISGHSPSDASSYRSKEEIEAWQKEIQLCYGKRAYERIA